MVDRPVYSRCRGCLRLIAWCPTERGRMMPIDAEEVDGEPRPKPYDDGNVVIVGWRGGVPHVRTLRKAEVGVLSLLGEERYRSHHSTCPKASEFRPRAASR